MVLDEKRKLYLAVDNAPEEKTLPFHGRLEARFKRKYERLLKKEKDNLKKEKDKLEQQSKETGQKIEQDLNDTYTKAMKELRKRCLIAAGIGLGSVIMASLAYGTISEKRAELVSINHLDRDLNEDGVPDAYALQRNGHKIPMYGVKEYGRIRYVGKDQIGRYSNSNPYYQSIEDKLNQK